MKKPDNHFIMPHDNLVDRKYFMCEDREAKYPVFVYGTLKKGFFNNKRMFNNDMGDHKYIGDGYTTDKKYDFWSMQGVYPAIVDVASSPKYRVGGEIYVVDELIMCALDIMEHNYRRVCVPITLRGSKESMWCWMYLLSEENAQSGVWTQEDKQIKMADEDKDLKIWGGTWALEKNYSSWYKRGSRDYSYPKSMS